MALDNQEKKYEREKFAGPPVRLSGYRLAEPLCRRRCPNRKQMQQELAERRDPANVTAFFDNRRLAIPNPLAQIPECARVCERLRRAVENCERILLYCSRMCQRGDLKSPYPASRSSKNSTPRNATVRSNNGR